MTLPTYALAGALLLAASVPASALTVETVDFSFAGTLAQDNSVVLIEFTVAETSTIELSSYSYNGGVMADGTTIAAGGFDPILSLFDASGSLIASNDDIDSGNDEWDVYLSATLDAGDYTVAVTQYDNFAVDDQLADGWIRDGDAWFTASEFGGGECTAFCDANGQARSNAWAFDVLNVATAVVVDNGQGEAEPPASPVPLPAAAPALAAALGALGLLRRRRG